MIVNNKPIGLNQLETSKTQFKLQPQTASEVHQALIQKVIPFITLLLRDEYAAVI